MTRRRIDRFGMPRRRPVATAIIGGAKMRASLQDFSRNPDRGLTSVVAGVLAAAARILRNAAGLWRIGFVLLRPPVGGPFPDVSDHVVDAVAVRRKRGHRRGALIAVFT